MIGTMPRQTSEVGPRVHYLINKLAASHSKIESWEKEMEALKKVLTTEM